MKIYYFGRRGERDLSGMRYMFYCSLLSKTKGHFNLIYGLNLMEDYYANEFAPGIASTPH